MDRAASDRTAVAARRARVAGRRAAQIILADRSAAFAAQPARVVLPAAARDAAGRGARTGTTSLRRRSSCREVKARVLQRSSRGTIGLRASRCAPRARDLSRRHRLDAAQYARRTLPLADPGEARAAGALMKHVRPWTTACSRPAARSLVGPNGVGKTTTIAKLATRWVLEHGPRDVALVISLDHDRIGAHEQLLTFGPDARRADARRDERPASSRLLRWASRAAAWC
jgi:flagellar biosynthesis protein FlhF